MHAHLSDLTLAKLSGVFATLSGASGIFFAATDAVTISAITSAAAVLMAGVSAYFAYKAKAVSEGTHKAVNSRLDEFMKLAKEKYYADGKLEGRAQEKSERGERDKPIDL